MLRSTRLADLVNTMDPTVRVSRVNQATRRSFSIAAWARASTRCDLPVPEGLAS
jgi:hypothetical protein